MGVVTLKHVESWYLCSSTGVRIHVPCIGRWIPNYWTTSKVPQLELPKRTMIWRRSIIVTAGRLHFLTYVVCHSWPTVYASIQACQWASSQIILKAVTQFFTQRCLRVLVVLEWESRTSPKIHTGIDGLVRWSTRIRDSVFRWNMAQNCIPVLETDHSTHYPLHGHCLLDLEVSEFHIKDQLPEE